MSSRSVFRRRVATLLVVTLFAGADASSQTPPNSQVTPEAPSLWREVTGVRNKGLQSPPSAADVEFLRPHLPAWRTTADGRLGVINEGPGPSFGLFKPEKLTTPVMQSTDFLETMHDLDLTQGNPLFDASSIDFVPDAGWSKTHVCLWDPPGQPHVDGPDDVYSIYVVVTARNAQDAVRIYSTPVDVRVTNPKTAAAAIASVTAGTPVAGPALMQPVAGGGSTPVKGRLFEPVVAAGGQLFVARVNSNDMTWNYPPVDPVLFPNHQTNPAPQLDPRRIDVVYAWSDTPNAVADPANWTELYPITLAPYDDRINDTLGFALAPFRDPFGVPLIDPNDVYTDDTIDLGGSYPWIDREADNLFFETLRDRLSVIGDVLPANGRYPTEVSPLDQTFASGAEDSGPTRGIVYVGKWTHGKVVQLDNLNNDMDYAVGGTSTSATSSTSPGPQQRIVTLYQPNTGPSWWPTWTIGLHDLWADPDDGKLLLGYGRATSLMPKGENTNANIIDSIENKLNHNRHAFPLTPRDVVWHMNNSRQTDELAFDDSLEPDALIVAHMTGALEYEPFGTNRTHFEHHTGWNGSQFASHPRLSNSATAPSDRWALPEYGQVLGDGRVEPVANGGVYGKGFWMDATIGVRFTIPAQAPPPAGQEFDDHDWYVGLFVDSRFTDDGDPRRLLTFPDGSSLDLIGRSQVAFIDSAGIDLHRASIPAPLGNGSPLDDLLPEKGWAHLALQIRDEGRDVELLLDGFPLSRWRSTNGETLFTIGPGDLVVGAPNGSGGFIGWIDEFKVFAHTMDLESAANHAGGTLIGLDDTYTGPWRTDFADRFADWIHADITEHLHANGEPVFDRYAVFHDYRNDHAVDLRAIDATSGLTSLRASIHFPEGPLFHDAPRPSSVNNAFCLTCHHAGAEQGLDIVNALGSLPFDAKDDPRRQPSQSAARVHGWITTDLADGTLLPHKYHAPAGGEPVDEHVMPSWTGPATVVSYTLLAHTTDEILLDMPVVTSAPYPVFPEVDHAEFGTYHFKVRANLDSAQGSVDMSFNGGPVVTVDEWPFEIDCDPAALDPTGDNWVTALPSGGSLSGTAFRFLPYVSTPRALADYRGDFRAGVPSGGWIYAWNERGAVKDPDAIVPLNWLDAHARYTDHGLAFPEAGGFGHGSFHATGGHAGLGDTQGSAYDRFAMAGFRVKTPGFYSVVGEVGCTSTQGQIDVRVYHQIGQHMELSYERVVSGDATTDLGTTAVHALSPGDVVWICVGPDGVNAHDGFTLDAQVVFNEAAF